MRRVGEINAARGPDLSATRSGFLLTQSIWTPGTKFHARTMAGIDWAQVLSVATTLTLAVGAIYIALLAI